MLIAKLNLGFNLTFFKNLIYIYGNCCGSLVYLPRYPTTYFEFVADVSSVVSETSVASLKDLMTILTGKYSGIQVCCN